MADYVSVGLRLPAGLVIEHGGGRYKLNGWNQGANQHTPNREAFGITDNVPKAVFDGWYATQVEHGTDLVKNDLVFAADSPAAARDKAAERMRNVRSGFEGLNPEDPMPGQLGPDGKPIKFEPNAETRKMLEENAAKS